MTQIFPIPIGRTSDLLFQRRLEGQVNSNQIALLRLQDQLATGRRLSVPSDDPAASQRGIALQRVLEQKTQVRTNLSNTQSYLSASETAIAGVGSLLADVRADVLGANDAAHTDAERDAAALQVRQAIDRLTEIGNQQFRGRFLFAGSNTAAKPFDGSSAFVAYLGNEAEVRSFADVDTLFASNLSGQQVFGGLSAEARGTADLNPSLSPNTRLADLHGGRGLPRGPIKVTDGISIRIVDLSSAETLADVASLLEANPPAGRTLTVQIASDHLVVSIDGQPGTNLTIQEVAGGTTAGDLGILASFGVGNGPVTGTDLNPRLRATSRLDSLLGGAFDQTSGLALVNGGQTFNLSFATSQTVEDLLNVINNSGAGVLAEINAAGTGIDIRSRLSGADFSIGENGGTTATQLGVRTFTRETRLADLNRGRGVTLAVSGDDFVIHRRDGTDLNINLAGVQSIGDVIDRINTLPGNTDPLTSVVARLRLNGNGIELVDANAAGTDPLSVTKGATSFAAWDLGLVTRDTPSATALVSGASQVLSGADVNPRETAGVFNSLLRLHSALTSNDQLEIDRTLALLDDDLSRVSFARADLGARGQSLDTIGGRLEDEEIELRSTLSNEIEADLVKVISELTSRQAAVEASLRLIGQISQLTLLDFL